MALWGGTAEEGSPRNGCRTESRRGHVEGDRGEMPLRTHALRHAAPCPDPAVAPAQASPTPLAGPGRAAACARLASNPPESAARLLKRIGDRASNW